METSLREAPVFGPNGSIPVPMAAVPTERIARPASSEPSDEPVVIEKGVLISRSTLAGLCLTAFACGIITTVAISHGGRPPVVAQQAVEQQPAAEPPPAPPVAAKPAAAEVAAAAPAPADPLVVQMAAAPAAEPERAVDKPPAHALAARTPRPPV
ncbi:MAG TPA: hypothetical protein VHO67_16630, partial [Polyangia bacterium]|nr:hypothetical protein [Polyangia bacterium]